MKCQSTNDYFYLSYIEYIEMFGEDSHLWKASQKIEPKKATFASTLKTKRGNSWVVADLDGKVAANCLTDGIIEIAGKKIKKPRVVSTSFSYRQYIEFFGEDDHINNKVVIQKRFGL